MARYVIRASNDTATVEFDERLTIEAALEKAKELGESHFRHVTLVNVLTGIEITDLEAIMTDQGKT